ncbi:MAG: hypothetical protein WHX52_02955 [Anaerolineae bacterium]
MVTWIKYIKSFLKSDWTLEDYPIAFKHSDPDASCTYRGAKPVPWFARIVNWWPMFSHGETKEEAYAGLRQRFDAYKNAGNKLPRPGVKHMPPIEIVSQTEIQKYESLAVDFFEKVIGMHYHDCLVTDLSSLWDFPGDETNDAYHRKIAEVYGVDVSDIESGILVEIFRRISETGKFGETVL